VRLLGLFFRGLVLLAVVGLAGCSESDDGPPGASVDVVAGDDFFDPDRFTVPAGRVEFIVANRGKNPHTFVIEGIGFKLRLFDPGEIGSGVVRVDPGPVAFYCDIEGHREAGMEGLLVVDPQDA